MKHRIWLAMLTICASSVFAQDSQKSEPEEKAVAYIRTINERATKIVATLGITEAAKSNRVHEIIFQQYRGLNDIHWVRDVEIGEAKAKHADDKAATNIAIEAARAKTKPKLEKLHGEFLTKLATELSPEQVDKVKDGLTYGVAPLTYGVYLKMYPELTGEQKAQIKSWLNEARELAMDGSTAEEKHAVFGKYKGKITNYLSKAGYDAKKGEANLKKATQPPSDSKPKQS